MAPHPHSSNLVALVTGASRGIGCVVAMQLAQRGVRIALHYRSNRHAAESVLARLAGNGHALVDADLGDPAATTRLWQRALETQGRIDVLVNNAGEYLMHPPLNTDYAAWQSAWQRTIATNLHAPANLSLLAAQSMAARPDPFDSAFGRGRIVNVSSRGAFRGEPDAPAYGASKAGLNALSQSLAKATRTAGDLRLLRGAGLGGHRDGRDSFVRTRWGRNPRTASARTREPRRRSGGGDRLLRARCTCRDDRRRHRRQWGKLLKDLNRDHRPRVRLNSRNSLHAIRKPAYASTQTLDIDRTAHFNRRGRRSLGIRPDALGGR